MVMARVMPRVAVGTAGSSGSPEAEDAVAMAAFTTLNHELISACSGAQKDNWSAWRMLCVGGWLAHSGEVEEEEVETTASSHWRERPL